MTPFRMTFYRHAIYFFIATNLLMATDTLMAAIAYERWYIVPFVFQLMVIFYLGYNSVEAHIYRYEKTMRKREKECNSQLQ